MDDFLKLIELDKLMSDRSILADVALTAALTVVFLFLRSVTLLSLRKSDRFTEVRELHLRNNLRNGSFALWLIGLLAIWGHQLQEVAFSLAAIAVAVVIGSKELLMCALGFFIRVSGDAFSVGDRIEIQGIRGDVVDHSMLTTTILEIGPGHQRTGRSLVIPNSLFLTDPIINETFTKDYVLHVIRVPMTVGQDWRKAEGHLLRAGQSACAPYLESAQRYMSLQSKRHGLKAPIVAPRISVQMPEPGRVDLLLRIPALARDKGKIEQLVLRLFFDQFDELAAGT